MLLSASVFRKRSAGERERGYRFGTSEEIYIFKIQLIGAQYFLGFIVLSYGEKCMLLLAKSIYFYLLNKI